MQDRIIECDKQKANLACIKIPDSMSVREAIKIVQNTKGLKYVEEVWIIHENEIEKIKK